MPCGEKSPSPHLPLAAGLLLDVIKNSICSHHPSDQLVGCPVHTLLPEGPAFLSRCCCGCELRGPRGDRLWHWLLPSFPPGRNIAVPLPLPQVTSILFPRHVNHPEGDKEARRLLFSQHILPVLIDFNNINSISSLPAPNLSS